MRRNHRRRALQLGAVAKSLLVCGYIGAAGLGYVWQKNQIYRLGDELKKREATLAAAQKRNAILAAQLAQSKSPAQLEARCRQYNLWLVAPRENQIVRLCEPGAEWDSPSVVAKMLSAAKHNPPAEVLARR